MVRLLQILDVPLSGLSQEICSFLQCSSKNLVGDLHYEDIFQSESRINWHTWLRLNDYWSISNIGSVGSDLSKSFCPQRSKLGSLSVLK